MFQDRQLEGAPRPLTELGLPSGEPVDAVFSWPLNGKTYLVHQQRYWRYDETAARPDPGYPKNLGLWEGAPGSPDDVMVDNAGDTYFFKGTHYWRFPKGSIKADPDSPKPMGPKWLDCPAPSSPSVTRSTPQTGHCHCHCDFSRGTAQLTPRLVLLLAPLLLGLGFGLGDTVSS